MKKYLTLFLVIVLTGIAFSITIAAHPGNTDAQGGHYEGDTGEYHYHHGFPAHQHPNGICPYNFKNNVSDNSNSSFGSSAEHGDGISGLWIYLVVCLVGIVCLIIIIKKLKERALYNKLEKCYKHRYRDIKNVLSKSKVLNKSNKSYCKLETLVFLFSIGDYTSFTIGLNKLKAAKFFYKAIDKFIYLDKANEKYFDKRLKFYTGILNGNQARGDWDTGDDHTYFSPIIRCSVAFCDALFMPDCRSDYYNYPTQYFDEIERNYYTIIATQIINFAQGFSGDIILTKYPLHKIASEA